jgi:hypothetical protein
MSISGSALFGSFIALHKKTLDFQCDSDELQKASDRHADDDPTIAESRDALEHAPPRKQTQFDPIEYQRREKGEDYDVIGGGDIPFRPFRKVARKEVDIDEFVGPQGGVSAQKDAPREEKEGEILGPVDGVIHGPQDGGHEDQGAGYGEAEGCYKYFSFTDIHIELFHGFPG